MSYRWFPHRESVQHGSVEGIEDTDGAPVGGYKDLFTILTELQPSPLTNTTELGLKGRKGTLNITRAKQNRTYSRRLNE